MRVRQNQRGKDRHGAPVWSVSIYTCAFTMYVFCGDGVYETGHETDRLLPCRTIPIHLISGSQVTDKRMAGFPALSHFPFYFFSLLVLLSLHTYQPRPRVSTPDSQDRTRGPSLEASDESFFSSAGSSLSPKYGLFLATPHVLASFLFFFFSSGIVR